MIIVKVVKSEDAYGAVGGAVGSAYNIIVDSKKVLTLHPGNESVLDLPAGKYTLYARGIKFGDPRSNQLQIDVRSPEDNITIEVRVSGSELTASLAYGQIAMQYVSVKCDSCGATNRVLAGRSAKCEYCGTALNVPKQTLPPPGATTYNARQQRRPQQPYPQQPYPQQIPQQTQRVLRQKKGYIGPILLLIIGIITSFFIIGIPIVIIAFLLLVNRSNYNSQVDAENTNLMRQYGVQSPNQANSGVVGGKFVLNKKFFLILGIVIALIIVISILLSVYLLRTLVPIVEDYSTVPTPVEAEEPAPADPEPDVPSPEELWQQQEEAAFADYISRQDEYDTRADELMAEFKQLNLTKIMADRKTITGSDLTTMFGEPDSALIYEGAGEADTVTPLEQIVLRYSIGAIILEFNFDTGYRSSLVAYNVSINDLDYPEIGLKCDGVAYNFLTQIGITPSEEMEVSVESGFSGSRRNGERHQDIVLCRGVDPTIRSVYFATNKYGIDYVNSITFISDFNVMERIDMLDLLLISPYRY